MRSKKIKNNQKYIIVEIIPTAIHPIKGPVAQISALKLKGLQLIDRFDYRLVEDKIYNQDILKMINYDKDKFIYEEENNTILKKFKTWIEDLELLIIDNDYTINYLEYLSNKKESIFSYLGLKFSDEVIDKIIKKYQLEPSNYIVDLLYEALIYENNKTKKI